MQTNKRLLAFLTALFMVIALASPMIGQAAGPIGSLTIHKLYFPDHIGDGFAGTGEADQVVPTGSIPLGGAKFTLWMVEDDAVIPIDGEFNVNAPGVTRVSELETNSSGIAEWPTLGYGRYYVKETFLPKGVTQGSISFMVDIPTTSADETRLIDNVHVYPKNVLTLGAAQLTKYTQDPSGRLPGAIFTLYKQDGSVPAPATDGVIKAGLVTNEEGATPVQENLEIGKYYFLETKAPEGYLLDKTPVAFEIEAGDHAYDEKGLIRLQIKQVGLANSEKPGDLVKEADKADVGIGDNITWTIKTTVPDNIDIYTEYKITDVLDPALNYNNNVVITFGDVTLTEGDQYTVTAPAVGENGTLVINFIPAKLKGSTTTGEIVVKFDTIVNEKAIAGKDINNKVILDYNNSFEEGSKTSEDTKVKVGGKAFKKVDKKGHGLKGAEFIVKRDSDNKYLIKDAKGMITWGNKNLATKFTSPDGGEFNVDGLAYGKYFLVETKAPLTYSKLLKPQAFTVGNGTEVVVLPIVNKVMPGMPQTGGVGTLASTAIGLIFIAIAAKTYKKEE